MDDAYFISYIELIVLQFGGLESPLTGFRDQFYRIFRHRWSREVLTLVIVTSAFLCSMPCTTYVRFQFLTCKYEIIIFPCSHFRSSSCFDFAFTKIFFYVKKGNSVNLDRTTKIQGLAYL